MYLREIWRKKSRTFAISNARHCYWKKSKHVFYFLICFCSNLFSILLSRRPLVALWTVAILYMWFCRQLYSSHILMFQLSSATFFNSIGTPSFTTHSWPQNFVNESLQSWVTMWLELILQWLLSESLLCSTNHVAVYPKLAYPIGVLC